MGIIASADIADLTLRKLDMLPPSHFRGPPKITQSLNSLHQNSISVVHNYGLHLQHRSVLHPNLYYRATVNTSISIGHGTSQEADHRKLVASL